MENNFSIWKTVETPSERSICLVNVSPEELGVTKKGLTYKDLCEIAQKQGLDFCPEEIAFILREQYKDQPSGEYLHLVSIPIDGRTGKEIRVIGCNPSGRLYLSTEPADPDSIYLSYQRFIFQKKNPNKANVKNSNGCCWLR